MEDEAAQELTEIAARSWLDEDGNERPPEKAPPEEVPPAPKTLTETRRVGGRLCIAGTGARPARIMVLANSVTEDECREVMSQGAYGRRVRQEPGYLKGANSYLKDVIRSCYLDFDKDVYYTAVIKHLLPDKNHRNNPPKAELEWAMPVLEHELKTIKPEVVVTMGKLAMTVMTGRKTRLDKLRNGWLWSDKYKCRVYPIEDVTKPVTRPDYIEKFRQDFVEVVRLLDGTTDLDDPQEVDYRVVHDMFELREMVACWRQEQVKVLSTDAEWHGNIYAGGQVRSVQFCDKPGRAWYVRFRDEQNQYAFRGGTYAQVGAVLREVVEELGIKFIGHYLSVDLQVLAHVFGIDFYGRAVFDTAYAQSIINEYEDQGLERIALKYTTLGRYDVDLELWKEDHRDKVKEGYGYIPDDLLIVYACRDVDCPMRAWPRMRELLEREHLTSYYEEFLLPFVTDVFTTFSIEGLPMDRPRMDEMRRLYSAARDKLVEYFRHDLVEEAGTLLREQMVMALSEVPDDQVDYAMSVIENLVHQEGKPDEAQRYLVELVGIEHLTAIQPFFDHWLVASVFNIRSVEHMRRWLFQVKGHTPVKTVPNKAKGIPSMSWEKVSGYSRNAQADYSPSTDKQTLNVLAPRDPMIARLLEVNAVGNLCKAFLKEATVEEKVVTGEDGQVLRDDDGEEVKELVVVKEQGLHKWLCDDGRIHGFFSCTETGRPRSWNPNTYNLPSYINDNINDGVARVLERALKDGALDEDFRRYISYDDKGRLRPQIPPIRACMVAPEGWCIVESDYQTAEIHALAYLSGDENLIRLMVEKDPDFGVLASNPDVTPRLRYSKESGFRSCYCTEELLLAHVENGNVIARYTEADLLRDANGELVHPRYDLHWSLTEMVTRKPRELLDKKKDRGGTGKVGNFSSAYGASENSLERKIEADTKSKPEPGTGKGILEALARRQPVAEAWLKDLEQVPVRDGIWRAASGRLRHFSKHPDSMTLGFKARQSILSDLGRQARNFPMQGIVADTSARACKNLLAYVRAHNMRARPVACLYDSIVSLCPLEERFLVRALHQRFMSDENTWTHHGRTWKFGVDHELNPAWSWPAAKKSEERKKLYDTTYRARPTWVI